MSSSRILVPLLSLLLVVALAQPAAAQSAKASSSKGAPKAATASGRSALGPSGSSKPKQLMTRTPVDPGKTKTKSPQLNQMRPKRLGSGPAQPIGQLSRAQSQSRTFMRGTGHSTQFMGHQAYFNTMQTGHVPGPP